MILPKGLRSTGEANATALQMIRKLLICLQRAGTGGTPYRLRGLWVAQLLTGAERGVSALQDKLHSRVIHNTGTPLP